MTLYDAHNHLQDARLDSYRDEILELCRTQGVVSVVNGTRVNDWESVQQLAEQHPWIIPSFGYHPWYIHEAPPDWHETLISYLDARPSAVGEIGLDLWKEGLDRERQEHFFLTQLSLAASRNLPASIHCLRAWDWLVSLLKKDTVPSCGFLLHSFAGERQHLSVLIERGAYFSCAGYFLHPRKRRTLEMFRHIPLDRILVETDAPDQCLPEELDRFGLRVDGERLNHPGNVRIVYEHLAEVLSLPVERLEQQVGENFRRLFGGIVK